MRLWITAASMALAGCTSILLQPAPADSVLHYVRSNRDGSEAENIVMFRPSPTQVSVYKYVSRCTTAAYVTATMDSAIWEATSLDAGKVARDGSQAKFGRIDLDPATRTLSAWVDTPGGRLTDSVAVPDRPWHLFDYDLASLNAALQETRPSADFSFGLALVWPDETGPKFFRNMGRVNARHRGIEHHFDRQTRRFELALSGAKPGAGTLWLDAATGTIVDAEFDQPNHPGSKDFRLKLERVEPGGQAAWNALLKRHFSGCPAKPPTGN